MKKLLLAFTVFAMSFATYAQIETPAPSPFSKVEQKVGLTDVTIEYSRPGVKGRAIFGDLEPFGGVWRTGANKNTIITFSDDVTIAGQDVKAGAYAVFTKLNSATQWDVMFYNDTNNWGTPREWDDSKVVATAKVDVHAIPFNVETLTIDINNLTNVGGTIDIIWEKSYVAIPFTVPTDKLVSTTIDKVMAGPSANDYYASAVYYLNEGKDINKAKSWIDKAMSMIETPGFWQVRQQSLIYAAAGDKKGAIELAKKSMAGAKESGNQNYVKQNMESLKEWGAM
ncbi:dihydrolipoamide dehydrogenase [Flavobacteriales bacterium 33_180_T64]|nr:dihydrolipoamide dehydrogenase [Flavobacteriales bacterium 33_180_T64]